MRLFGSTQTPSSVPSDDGRYRLLRSNLLRDIRLSRTSLRLVLVLEPLPEWMAGMTVGELCLSRRYIGHERLARALAGTGVDADDALGGLTLDERRLAAAALVEAYPNLAT